MRVNWHCMVITLSLAMVWESRGGSCEGRLLRMAASSSVGSALLLRDSRCLTMIGGRRQHCGPPPKSPKKHVRQELRGNACTGLEWVCSAIAVGWNRQTAKWARCDAAAAAAVSSRRIATRCLSCVPNLYMMLP